MSDEYKMTALTFLDRETRSGSYMLVSYSHRDARMADALLTDLYKKGANYWYDTEMHIGDNWKERVLTYLKPEKGCCGVIFLISTDYLLSDSCGWELEQFLNVRKTNAAFRAFVVLIHETTPVGNETEFLFDQSQQEILRRMTVGTLKSTATRDQNYDYLKKLLSNNENLFASITGASVPSLGTSLYCDIFKRYGCTSKGNESILNYARSVDDLESDIEKCQDQDGKSVTKKNHYKLSFGRIAYEQKRNDDWDELRSTDAEWTAFDLQNDTLSLILRQRNKIMGSCGRILAKNRLQRLQNNYLLYEDKDGKNRKRLIFTEEELARLTRIRFLYKSERENDNLKSDINWALSNDDFDAEANDYFFVMAHDEQGKTQYYYADRFSGDVYENVWRDEIASVIPVIDVKTLKE